VKEGGFINLMEYSGKEDTMKPTDTLVNGESEVLNRIASYVREWSGNWEAVWENIQLRSKIKQTLVELSEKLKMPGLLEADWIVKSNSMFHMIGENIRKEVGFPEPKRIHSEWMGWLNGELKRLGK
jgi:hypothetical protein